jgi:hypothetical protein
VTASDESDDERRGRGLPAAPRLPDETGTPARPPKPVQVSFWLWVVSGVVFIAGYLVLFLARNEIISRLVAANTNKAVTADQISRGMTMVLAVLLIGAISFAAFYVLFAYKARQGTRSARTVLTVLVAITLVFQLVFQFFTVITLVATLIALVALVLMYLPTVTDFFPKVPRLGDNRRGGTIGPFV